MALKALLLKKQIDNKKKTLEDLRAKNAEFETREAELANAIDEVENDEQRAQVEEMVTAYDTEKADHDKALSDLEREIEDLETALAAEEAAQNTDPVPAADPAPAEEARKDESNMITREKIPGMTIRDRLATIVTRDEVKAYLDEVRTAIREKRAITNVGLTIPEVLLGLLRENVINYSKLYRHVSVRPVSGTARLLIMGAVPEAVWTDCCANLNELTLGFNDLEMDCYKVGGFFAICNATLEDSDINLSAELLSALGQAIGIALDRAILYGRNTDDTQKMPMGIVTRLAQTSKPAGYPATGRAWEDLHTSNIKTLNATGLNLFQGIQAALASAKGKYSRGELVHVMNEATYSYLVGQAMSINANGAIVTGLSGVMPVTGGIIEVLSIVPDNVIISGYFDLYVLAERAGQQFATSEHVRFLQDQTVIKGTARYDGAPAIAEAFVAIGVQNTTPDATTGVTFAADEANSVKSIALNTSTASLVVSNTVQLFAITGPGSGTVTWASATTSKATVDNNGVVTGVGSGSSVITATCNGLTASCTVTVTST